MKPGDKAPDFALADQTGALRRLSELLNDGPVVLFFYPAAFTPGCTKEACHFRDLAAEFAAAGVQRIGISRDAVEKQDRWTTEYQLDYPL
ncbi:MAG: peroxiredoxin, partial [Gordonia sp. (in: high G+C Gram-positive bacteria)]|uniref:peroxiredoxin n=1 Tax=Gordonia sp. (in: high G+C Gram-positive bacteria) TaxID=84139 RepID=UPI003BB61C86